ncbi:DUF397 domain-containing protein [Streptomyces sp. NPDC004609]|uniref:DUF397 domain-containing protein n=1 Tax=Streptomyces sp. NPDC004609 TaxID=3364704 RepID=UPI0036B479B6
MRTNLDLTRATWVKSSYSNGNGGGCVEHAPAFAISGAVPVRDSKDPEGPALVFSVDGWHGFISAVKADEFAV